MEIVKKLNLNKTPQSVDNNSIVFAKNIKLSSDEQYLTNEESLIGAASVLNSNEKIVGVIPTNKELVVFKYNASTKASYIIRVKEKEEGVESINVPTTWKYTGGKITGTYTYNVKNQLIVAIGEFETEKDVPLKTINLDTSTISDNSDLYNIAPDIAICNCKLLRLISGAAIPNGIYHLFVRYEIANNVYTKWFPIGAPYYAINLQEENIINHKYAPKGASGYINTAVNEVYNNDELNVPYNFELELTFNNSDNFISYQIGYILQHNDTQVARLWKKFSLLNKTTYTITFNTDGASEYSIEELVEDTYNIYNVENICNYNNRLYISNYKETDVNIDFRNIVNNIKINYVLENNDVETTSHITFSGVKNGVTITKSIDATYKGNYVYEINFLSWFNSFGCKFTDSGLPRSDSTYFKDNNGSYTRVTSMYLAIGSDDLTWHIYTSGGGGIPFPLTGGIYQYNNPIALDLYDFTSITVEGSSNKNIDIVGKYTKYINKKSLIPNQVYNFFIHFVKSDGSHTNGIRIPNNNSSKVYTFKGTIANVTMNCTLPLSAVSLPDGTSTWIKNIANDNNVNSNRICDIFNNFDNNTKTFGYYENIIGDSMFVAPDIKTNAKIGIQVTDITIPNDYIGCFLSYEKVEQNVQYTAYPITTNKFVASDAQLAITNYSGLFIKQMFKQNYAAGTSEYTIGNINEYKTFAIQSIKPLSANNISVNDYDTRGQGSSIYIESIGSTIPETTNGSLVNEPNFYSIIHQIYIANKYLYSKENKELIRLGGITYKSAIGEVTNARYSESDTHSDFNYPGFIVEDRILIYSENGVNLQEDGYVLDNNNNYYGSSGRLKYAAMVKFFRHSNFQLLAESIKKKPEILVTSVNEIRYANQVVYPINYNDLIDFKSTYKPVYLKALINYNSTLIPTNKYSRTIRRSDVIRTESVENSWRYFRADAYKVISENKGNITNIVGIGLYLLIHTEHSLFMFNRDASMKTQDKDIQLYIPDAFDTEYQEVFTSEKGYGGLQDKYAWALNEHGYIFYDSDAKQIYNFDNGNLKIVSQDIIQFIKAYKIIKTRMVIDGFNNRLLICFEIKDNHYVTISYSFAQNTYISLHDYYFDYGWNTKNYCYLFGENPNVNKEYGKTLYTFKDSINIGIYNGLQFKDNTIFPAYYNDDGNICYSVIDIIFNVQYETVKSLEYINYILTELLEYNGYINQAEEEVNRRYSGYQLRLYTDSCRSKLLDINVDNLPNKFNNYKYPYYEKGKWNLNYFRNYIESSKADNQSLIYGKYIVASFIFNNDSQKRIKLENINFGVNKY